MATAKQITPPPAVESVQLDLTIDEAQTLRDILGSTSLKDLNESGMIAIYKVLSSLPVLHVDNSIFQIKRKGGKY